MIARVATMTRVSIDRCSSRSSILKAGLGRAEPVDLQAAEDRRWSFERPDLAVEPRGRTLHCRGGDGHVVCGERRYIRSRRRGLSLQAKPMAGPAHPPM